MKNTKNTLNKNKYSKLNNKKNNIISYNKLAFLNSLIALILVIILYFALPKILNYPTNTIDNDFQIKVVGITYTSQFLIIATLIVTFIYLFVRLIYKKLYNGILGSKDSIIKTRKKCFNIQYIMLIVEVLLPTTLCFFLLILFKTNMDLLVRISIVIFSFASIFGITSYMISRSFFRNLLIKTSNYCKNDLNTFRINTPLKLLILTLPLFICSFVLILLISTTTMTIEKGDLLYNFYKQELINSLDEENLSLDDIKNKFNSFEYKSDNDFALIMNADNGEIIFKSKNINISDEAFLSNYTLSFYEETDGQCFEYYGQTTQSCMHKVILDDGTYYIGIHFETFSNSIFLPFFICITVLIIFIVIYISYIGKTITTDITNITNGMNSILNLNNISNANNLPITSNDEFGNLTISYNKIQDLTISHIKQIEYNQDKLMEQERLASLGQLIGGIAHNLKTPIMSISGASKGLEDLIQEYNDSIGDIDVTNEDHHEIASEMNGWVKKIKTYTEYMSDIITTVKGQVVTLSNTSSNSFTIEELLKSVDILMKHELKNALITLNIISEIPNNLTLQGNINSLVQVINNMISNSIQAYNGKTNQSIDLILKKENINLIISIKDYASGIPKEVQDKLFNEMITTKGKNGTGLGLFMSYSTIRANFNGNITFESKENCGTTFNIIIPIN